MTTIAPTTRHQLGTPGPPLLRLPNKLSGPRKTGIDYAYRDNGIGASGGVPLVLFQPSAGKSTDGIPR